MNKNITFIDVQQELNPSQEAIKMIQQDLTLDIGDSAYNLTKKDLNTLLQFFKTYQNELNNIAIALHSIDDHIDSIRKKYIEDKVGFQKDGEPPSINYVIFLEIKKLLPSISETLKKGYQIISLTRQMFTNEKIIYEVGIESKKGGIVDIRNFEISEESLLNAAGLTYNPKAKNVEDLLKLNVTAYGTISAEENQAKSDIEKQLSGKKTVFGKVVSVLTNEKYLPYLNNKKVNRGYIYEAYKLILSKRQYSNKKSKNLTPNEIMNAYKTVTKNNLIFYSGGDFLNKQYKLLSSKPQIISFKTLCIFFDQFIKEFSSFLETNNKQDFINFIQKQFVQNTEGRKIIDKIAQQAELKARENIKEIILNI